MFKPFKPLSLFRKPTEAPAPVTTSDERPVKRQKLGHVQIHAETPPNDEDPPTSKQNQRYSVLWRKPSTKKNKTWEGDGIVTVAKGYATLHDENGKVLGKSACKVPLLPGSALHVGGREIEVDAVLSQTVGAQAAPTKSVKTAAPSAQYRQSRIAPLATAVKKPFSLTTAAGTSQRSAHEPRHDPLAPNALVMKRPEAGDRGIVDVVVDPLLCKHLRQHQREGVSFMYECVMGLRGFDGEGAILADEMGLGKTLQSIALIWTLLKQSPFPHEKQVIKKAMIVCPVTLIENWRKEFRKWLPHERLGVLVADANTRISDFTRGKSYQVMIIGYEKLRNVQAELQKGTGIDLIIADEGHRLKTAQNKSAQAIRSLNTERRIILSGTPLQNDLSEFYTMVDFVNPGLLGKYSSFRREFESVIVRSREPNVSPQEAADGLEKTRELAEITTKFVLRRSADILSDYLPTKTEYIVFCRPTDAQACMYDAIISTGVMGLAVNNSETSLQLIQVLKKVCNSPSLLTLKRPGTAADGEVDDGGVLSSLLSAIPANNVKTPAGSAKLRVLDQLLDRIRSTTTEKVVIVSNYTTTLDMISTLLTSLDHAHVRLDGSTAPSARQKLVDKFNRTSADECFAFLLSAKAGGVGLNLTGASRLVLFDIDWNPATDMQAMGRIHRDGQARPCHIYRLLLKGALDEKIYQRQVTKQGLADSVVDKKRNVVNFSPDELRDLFSLDRRAGCQTHDSLGCACGGVGVVASSPEHASFASAAGETDDGDEEEEEDDLPEHVGFAPASRVDVEAREKKRLSRLGKLSSLMRYAHFDTAATRSAATAGEGLGAAGVVEDDILRAVVEEADSRVDYVFAKTATRTVK